MLMVSGDFVCEIRETKERLVGERGFEPPTPWSRTRCSTRLSHSPTVCGRGRTLRRRIRFVPEDYSIRAVGHCSRRCFSLPFSSCSSLVILFRHSCFAVRCCLKLARDRQRIGIDSVVVGWVLDARGHCAKPVVQLR